MIKKISNNNCDLLIFNKLKIKNFKIKRIFYLISKKKCIRGDHAHKKCSQFFFSLKGKIKIKIFDGKKITNKLIIPGKKGILVKPMNWVQIYLNKNNTCMVLCDREYEKNDYLRNKSLFLKKKSNNYKYSIY